MLAIRDFLDTLPLGERICNGCTILKVQKHTGPQGQMVTPFGLEVCRCDEYELMWAYRGVRIDRPLECILNGQKYLV